MKSCEDCGWQKFTSEGHHCRQHEIAPDTVPCDQLTGLIWSPYTLSSSPPELPPLSPETRKRYRKKFRADYYRVGKLDV